MRSVSLSLPVTVLAVSSDPYESFKNDQGEKVNGSERRTAWLQISPGAPPLVCKVPDDCDDWYDLVKHTLHRVLVTVDLRGGNKDIFGVLVAAGPLTARALLDLYDMADELTTAG